MAPKKKPSKKEKARLTAELLEKLRLEQELEAAKMAELERQRFEEEKRLALKKDEEETAEQRIREIHLTESVEAMTDIINFYKELAKIEREDMEWHLYIDCGRLPNAFMCDQMNKYLHIWEKTIENTTIEEASRRTVDVVKLLEDLENILDTINENEIGKIENLKWIRQVFRQYQSRSLNSVTYNILRSIDKNLRKIDISTADYNFNDQYITLSIWLKVQLPVPLPNPRRPPKPRLDVIFPNMNMQVLFPTSLQCNNMAIRAMYLKYDHLSDQCETFRSATVPPQLKQDLKIATRKEWRVKLKYKYNNRDDIPVKRSENNDSTSEDGSEDTNSESEEDAIPSVPYKKLEPSPNEYALARDEEFYSKMRKKFFIDLPANIINLRKYTIIGGVFHLDLLYQPPQPQNFININMNITGLSLPKKLATVPCSVIYVPPKPLEPGVRRLPEEIEEEMKKQDEEMEKLMLITVTWPQDVIFLELPIVCQWSNDEKRWEKSNVHDLKHIEEKSTLTFRTGVFGTFGLACLRYANLAFQAWEVKPELDGSILVQITAAILILEFNVKAGMVCLSQLQNSPNEALDDILGVYMKFYKLKRTMKEAGVDIFPEHDAFCYIENTCEKNWPMERHLYFDIARLGNCFNFAWSRWNIAAGRRNIVLQMREFFPSKMKQKTHMMLLVTPLKATFIDCTEVSQMFSDAVVENMKFAADLFNLIQLTSMLPTRKRIQGIQKETVFTLAQLLIAIRPLSFS